MSRSSVEPKVQLRGYGHNLFCSHSSRCLEILVWQYFEEAFCAPKYGWSGTVSRAFPLIALIALLGAFFRSTLGAAAARAFAGMFPPSPIRLHPVPHLMAKISNCWARIIERVDDLHSRIPSGFERSLERKMTLPSTLRLGSRLSAQSCSPVSPALWKKRLWNTWLFKSEQKKHINTKKCNENPLVRVPP